MRNSSCLIAALLLSMPLPARADMLFHIAEVVFEIEQQPRAATHTVRWDGYYYVTDKDVRVSGWGVKKDRPPVPFDEPRLGRNAQGSTTTSTFHRVENGIDVEIEYGSFILRRQVRQTGPRTCTDTVTVERKPGHAFFEVRRISTGEPMLESDRRYLAMRCEVPALLG